MNSSLRWGVLGTGRIAEIFAKAVATSRLGRVEAVGSRTTEAAEAFARRVGVPRAYGSYEALLDDPDVQAVYIATIHPLHAQWAIAAAEAGKHILCEKPLTMNYPEAMAVVEAARRHDVFLMEAFMYRCHPQTAKLVELVRDGAIGDLRLVEASFCFNSKAPPGHRVVNHALGGGAILDLGCYPVSMARLLAGAASGQPFLNPADVCGVAHLGSETRVDEWAAASLRFPNGVVASLIAAIQLTRDNTLHLHGTRGRIHVPVPWHPDSRHGPARIIIERDGQAPEEIAITLTQDIFALEADLVATHIAQRQAPEMSWDDTLGNMQTLDQWRRSAGLVYDSEKLDQQTRPLHGRPLRVRPEYPMHYGTIDLLAQPVSQVIMGTNNFYSAPLAMVLFDHFFEAGGNAFDSALLYRPWREHYLATWLRTRGVRNNVTIIEKSAHPPMDRPEYIARELSMSLEHLQVDFIDLYLLHRDNTEVPVSEFIDALDAERRAGRIRAYGGSNWSPERVDEANLYAAEHGRAPMVAVSNQFSLAQWNEPRWGRGLTSSDPASRAWHERTRIPLLAWTTLASGFFSAARYPLESESTIAKYWHNEANFQRKERVEQFAHRHKIAPATVALAYVLRQPFPCFAVLGCKTLEELRTSLQALTLPLTPEELRWLNLES
ncbi:MAG: aldo/keto reductase [Phycisphaerae bacterium]|nr:aldo/keto reductase [Phycisphaerae bacterium]